MRDWFVGSGSVVGLLLRILAVGMWTGDMFGWILLMIALYVDDSAVLVVCFVSMLSLRCYIDLTMSRRRTVVGECVPRCDCWHCRFLDSSLAIHDP